MLRTCWLVVLMMLGLLVPAAGCEAQHDHSSEEDHVVTTSEPAVPLPTLLDTLFADYDRPFLQPVAYDTAAAARWVDSTLQALSLEEKIGQLFIISLPDVNGSRISAAMRRAVAEHHVGGFLMPRLLPPRNVYEVTRQLQQEARVPLFFAADYERGVGRFNNPLTELPANMAIGATRNPDFAAAAGRLTAIESRAVGVNLLFAPVVDVNNNPDNPIINIRSYGEKPALVGQMAAAFVEEAQAQRALTTLKHFPGHGNTAVDSHAEMGVIPSSRAVLDSVELKPYRMVFEQTRPAAVMSAHLWVEALQPEPLPATFSQSILTTLLRDSLGFEGMVVTDDVKMGALQNDYALAERVLRPLQAGADVILTPESLPAAEAALRRALRQGRLSEAALDRSVRRILEAKAQAGLYRQRFALREEIDYLLRAPRGEPVAEAIAEQALTLLKTAPVLPLQADQKIALVQLTNYRGSESIGAAMQQMADQLGGDRLVADVRYDREPSAAEQQEVLQKARSADVVVLPLYLRLIAGRGEAGLFPQQRQLARQLIAGDVPVVLLPFGNPYAVTTFVDADVHLVAYDQTLASADAAVRILQGTLAPSGRLPITVEPYAYSSGRDRL